MDASECSDSAVPSASARTRTLAPALTARLRESLRNAQWLREDCHLGAGVRFDLAAIIDGEIHGFEVKSEGDSLTRLTLAIGSQVESYGAVCDRVTLVAAPKHIARALDTIPAWWGVLRASDTGLEMVRPAGTNPGDARVRLARQLWVSEAKPLARQHGFGRGVVHKFDLTEAIAALPESVLREAVCAAIPRRPWR